MKAARSSVCDIEQHCFLSSAYKYDVARISVELYPVAEINQTNIIYYHSILIILEKSLSSKGRNHLSAWRGGVSIISSKR